MAILLCKIFLPISSRSLCGKKIFMVFELRATFLLLIRLLSYRGMWQHLYRERMPFLMSSIYADNRPSARLSARPSARPRFRTSFSCRFIAKYSFKNVCSIFLSAPYLQSPPCKVGLFVCRSVENHMVSLIA